MEPRLFLLTAFFLICYGTKTWAQSPEYQCDRLYEYNALQPGIIASPFYGQRSSYHNGLWCEYRIRAPAGYRIKIDFQDLDIQPSTQCAEDHLIVYNKDKRRVLGSFCGQNLPHSILTAENELGLLFRTAYGTKGRGFRLKYEAVAPLLPPTTTTTTTEAPDTFQCPRLTRYTAQAKHAVVTSPFYGQRSNYHKGLWCEYKIEAAEFHKIKLTFLDMDIISSPDCKEDVLVVAGQDKRKPMAAFCGYHNPSPVYSLDGENELNLIFKTGNTVGGRGFKLQYEQIPVKPYEVSKEASYEDNCHDLYDYDASRPGVITSPQYGNRSVYFRNLWCEWRIRAPVGDKIKITFLDMDIFPSPECDQDRLVIYGADKETTLAKYCRGTPPGPIFSKDGENEIRLLFWTRSHRGGRGFKLQYEAISNRPPTQRPTERPRPRPTPPPIEISEQVPDKHQCHDLYEYDATTPGMIYSPFYGTRRYYRGMWCEFRIRAPRGYRIRINFQDMDLHRTDRCVEDMLIIYGQNKQSVVGVFCGQNRPQGVMSNPNENEVILLFKTSSKQGGRGFVLNYQAIPERGN